MSDRRGYLRAYQRDWLAARRDAWLAATGPCFRCGSWERLEIDHVDPAVKVTAAVWSWAPERRDAELAKCQVLCEDCHRRKTTREAHSSWESSTEPHRGPAAPGTTGAYRRGCRCVDCCRAQSRYKAAYRARQQRRKLPGQGPKHVRWTVRLGKQSEPVPHPDPIDLILDPPHLRRTSKRTGG